MLKYAAAVIACTLWAIAPASADEWFPTRDGEILGLPVAPTVQTTNADVTLWPVPYNIRWPVPRPVILSPPAGRAFAMTAEPPTVREPRVCDTQVYAFRHSRSVRVTRC